MRKRPLTIGGALIAGVCVAAVFAGTASAGTLGTGVIKNSATATCITSLGNATNGAPLELWACNGSANQSWQVTTVSGNLVFRNNATGTCINDTDGVLSDGEQMTLWQCLEGPNEQFDPIDQGYAGTGGSPSILSVAGTDWNLTSGGDSSNGAPVELWTMNNSNNQVWNWPF
jgi:Ricin-type beta-trefoil lectin domain